MEKIKVFLSNPQILFREGIHFILSGEDDFEVTGETVTNDEALTHIEANPPNIAILSMEDSHRAGPEVTQRIKRSLPSVSVILTMDKSDEDKIFAAMKSGVGACITKDSDPEYLLDTIRVVTQGSQPIIESLLVPGLAARVLAEFKGLGALSEQLGNLLASLAPKESDVLSGIAAGSNMEQLTAKLNLNEEAIRRHLKVILNKLIANDQAQALIEAAQRSLPSLILGAGKAGTSSAQYVTKEEFTDFKETLLSRLKSLIG